MLQVVDEKFEITVHTSRQNLHYPFYKEFARSNIFVRLPVDQPPFARNFSGKVISSRKLLAMVNHAVALMLARDADRLAAENERLMGQSFAPAFHNGRAHMLHAKAHEREVVAFNIIDNAMNAEILG